MRKKKKNRNTQSNKFHGVILALTKDIVKYSGYLRLLHTTSQHFLSIYYAKVSLRIPLAKLYTLKCVKCDEV